jgi:hypothetical protein
MRSSWKTGIVTAQKGSTTLSQGKKKGAEVADDEDNDVA